jgi:hypothetical protein
MSDREIIPPNIVVSHQEPNGPGVENFNISKIAISDSF